MKEILGNRNFKMLAEQVTEAIVVTDANGRLNWCNNAFTELCGYAKDEIIGERVSRMLQGPLTDQENVQLIRDAIKAERPIKTELINYHKDGHTYWVQLSINPIKDKKNNTIGFMAIEHDTTSKHHTLSEHEEQIVELYKTLLVTFEDQAPVNEDPFSEEPLENQGPSVEFPSGYKGQLSD